MTTTDPTPLAEQIAREHRGVYSEPRHYVCACDNYETARDVRAHELHIATVTEQAVREWIAAQIEAHASAEAYGTESGVAWVGGWQSAIARTARIARGAGDE